jgi:hypothetical protein
LFDAAAESPSLLAVGDRVRFEPVPMAEFRRLEAAVQAREVDPASWLAPVPAAAALAGGR